jgi:hypothetical protein
LYDQRRINTGIKKERKKEREKQIIAHIDVYMQAHAHTLLPKSYVASTLTDVPAALANITDQLPPE